MKLCLICLCAIRVIHPSHFFPRRLFWESGMRDASLQSTHKDIRMGRASQTSLQHQALHHQIFPHDPASCCQYQTERKEREEGGESVTTSVWKGWFDRSSILERCSGPLIRCMISWIEIDISLSPPRFTSSASLPLLTLPVVSTLSDTRPCPLRWCVIEEGDWQNLITIHTFLFGIQTIQAKIVRQEIHRAEVMSAYLRRRWCRFCMSIPVVW